jgi:hypothetical protein
LKGIETMKTSKRLISLLLALALMLSVCSMMAFAVDEEEPAEEESPVVTMSTNVGAWYSTVSGGYKVNWNLAPIMAQLLSAYPAAIGWKIRCTLTNYQTVDIPCTNLGGSSYTIDALTSIAPQIIPVY